MLKEVFNEWLDRYTKMHWFMRVFTYFATVPSSDLSELSSMNGCSLQLHFIFFVSCPDEKDALTSSLKDSNRLIEEAKQREVQMQSKINSMDKHVNVLTDRDQEVCHVPLNFFLK